MRSADDGSAFGWTLTANIATGRRWHISIIDNVFGNLRLQTGAATGETACQAVVNLLVHTWRLYRKTWLNSRLRCPSSALDRTVTLLALSRTFAPSQTWSLICKLEGTGLTIPLFITCPFPRSTNFGRLAGCVQQTTTGQIARIHVQSQSSC